MTATLPLLGVSLGIILAGWGPGNDPDRWGPISWSAHVWGYLLFALPNTIFLGALIFALATWFRSTIVSFLGVILLLVGYSVSASLLSDLDNQQLAGLLDPFGIRTFGLETRYWTVAEKNAQYLTLTGLMLWNRLIWLGVGWVPAEGGANAAEAKEVVYSKVAATPAASKAGQMMKVRLLIQAYGTKQHGQDEDDLVARLIQSLSRDLSHDLEVS
ncbi:MAG: hypothetical protein ACKPHU_26575, partial [Planctomycetaceae bacterium]